jgi:enterochelin esterase-like enzyme
LRDCDLSPLLGGAAYAQFLATELLAYMDARFRTLAEPTARVLGGSSLGGLISFYVAIHHPGAYGNFACLSTAFGDLSQSATNDADELRALAAVPALPERVRMYFDYGTQGQDEGYEPYHLELGRLLRQKGWQEDKEFKIVRVEGGSHHEFSWRQRFGDALRFLAR